ncbi:formylglycine-generating enzyme family protein [Treponema denticola]|uniref:formylglycine-generating enzyme family protein n=1 Tax=Treponema denticola TaxID=158 RepID=UPI0040381F02
MTKYDLYNKTRVAALITAAVLALIALFGITACPNAAGGGGRAGSTVNITVKGDANVVVPAEPVAVWAGAKWRNVKTQVEGKVSFKPNFILNSWHLGEDASAPELNDMNLFTRDTTVYVKSRPKLPPLPKPENPGDPTVQITLKAHPAEAGQILGENPISVKKGTTWPQIQNYAKAAFKANYGFSEENVIWKKNGNTVDGTYTFDDDTTIFAEPEDLRITVTLTGDSRVTIAEPATITVIDGTKWKDLKTKAAAKVEVNDSNYAITAWNLDGESGTVLTDDYEFKKTGGTSHTIYAKTGDRRITITVKYERLYGPQVDAGTITVFDGDTWGSVKARVAREITIPDHFILSEWHWHGLASGFISDDYTFKVSKSVPGPAVAFIRPDIKLTISKNAYLTYYAPVNGSVTELKYYLEPIDRVYGDKIGSDDQVDNKERDVKLRQFQMGRTEIPQALYELVMGKNSSKFKGPSYPPAEGETQELRPVEQVTWRHAVLFCNELTRCTEGLGEKECVYTYDGHTYNFRDAYHDNKPEMDMNKRGFRLPTEAEWEWAAQSKFNGRRHKYSGTDIEDDLKAHYAWYAVNSGNKTHEVEKKGGNHYLLYDMSGNVAEWCWDWYSGSTPAGGQTDPTGPAEPVENYGRVVRGGSYKYQAHTCECAYRKDSSFSGAYIGFRIAARLW